MARVSRKGGRNYRRTTPEELAQGKRDTIWLTAFGEEMPLNVWADDPRSRVDRITLQNRVVKLGWDPEEALTAPPGSIEPWIIHSVEAFGEAKSLAEWARDPRCRVDYNTLYRRIVQYGRPWPAERAITTPASKRNRRR